MLAVYRLGVHVPTPGIDRQAMAAFFDQQKNTLVRISESVFRRRAGAVFGFFLGHHALYQRVDYSCSLLTVVFPYLERLSKEGEVGPAQDHPVYPLRHRGAVDYSGHDDQHRPGRHAGARRAQSGVESRLGISPHDRDYIDFGHGLYHVARRADHRTRHRQRHFLDYFCRHRRPTALGGHDDLAIHA